MTGDSMTLRATNRIVTFLKLNRVAANAEEYDRKIATPPTQGIGFLC
jgi:hypothetical protein